MKTMTTAFRVVIILIACLQNMMLGGVLYGWASISGTMLISDDGGPGLSRDFVHMMFVCASFANFLGPLLLGILLDVCGPRVCSFVSILLIAMGAILFALSDATVFPMFIPGMCLIAFGGPGTQSAIIHLSNLFPRWKATATAVITGSFQLSFVVFLIFDQAWLILNWNYQSLFLTYAAVCIAQAVVSIIVWPDTPYSFDEQLHPEDVFDADGHHPQHEEDEDIHLGAIRLPSVFIHKSHKHHQGGIHGQQQQLLRQQQDEEGETQRLIIGDRLGIPPPTLTSSQREQQQQQSGDVGSVRSLRIQDASLKEQLMSSEFTGLALFFLTNAFWANFYIGIFDIQIGDSRNFNYIEQRNFARYFTLAMTAGVLAIPVVGAIMDRTGYPFTALCTAICGSLWCFSLLIGTHVSLLFSFAFYSIYRTFFFTFFFAYLADSLGFKYFGVLGGIMFVMGGFLGLLQYPLAQWAAGQCHYETDDGPGSSDCDHGRWGYVNWAMTLSVVSTCAFSYFDRNRRREKAEREERERRRGDSGRVNARVYGTSATVQYTGGAVASGNRYGNI